MANALPVDLPVKPFRNADAWERWLVAHAKDPGVWLKIAKKDSGIASVTYAEAVEAALCHGWIDGQKRACDADWFLQRFTPRRAKSLWSKINIAKVEALEARGRMQAGGLREVEAARADGRWQAAYDPASTITVPDDLAAALKASRKAATFFAALDKTNRYALLWRIQTAKKPETRAARIATLVAMLATGQKIHG